MNTQIATIAILAVLAAGTMFSAPVLAQNSMMVVPEEEPVNEMIVPEEPAVTPVAEPEPVTEIIVVNGTIEGNDQVTGNVTDTVVVIPPNDTIDVVQNTSGTIDVVENATETIETADEPVLSDAVADGLLVLFQVQKDKAEFDQLSEDQVVALEDAINKLSGTVDEAVTSETVTEED